MAILTKTELAVEKNTRFADNTTGDITPERVRAHLTDIEDSMANTAGVSDGQIPIMSSTSGVLTSSAISETATSVAITKVPAFVPRIEIGTSEIRVLGELVYFATGLTSRLFTPVGTPFDDNGSDFPMYLDMGAIEQLPPGGTQPIRDATIDLTAGDSMTFIQPGAAGANHFSREATIDLTTTGAFRLEIYAGFDDTGRLLVDQTYENLGVGENTLVFDTFPYINDTIVYFSRYTALTDVTVRGTMIQGFFVPYYIARGWPFSEVRVLTDNDGAHIVDLIEALSGEDRLDAGALRNLPSALRLRNDTGSAIPPATPIVTLTANDGTLIGVPATAALLNGVSPTNQRYRIHGFTEAEVAAGETFVPVTAGIIPFSVTPEPAVNTAVWVEIEGDGSMTLTTTDIGSQPNSQTYANAGFVANTNATPDSVDIYVSAQQVLKSRADRIVTATAIDHPTTVRRDTPTIAELTDLAAGSINGNSALWIVSEDQDATTEAGVDPLITIQALRPGLFDANNVLISDDPVEKRTLRLAAGTIIRIFSGTDLRVIFSPVEAAINRFSDILPAASSIDLGADEATYNTYRDHTIVATDAIGALTAIMPDLTDTTDLAFVNRNDVFVLRNDTTAGAVVFTVRPNNVFSTGQAVVIVQPGSVAVVKAAPSGPVWQVLGEGTLESGAFDGVFADFGFFHDMLSAIALENNFHLYGVSAPTTASALTVQERLRTGTTTGNDVELRFRRHEFQDDVAWVRFWQTLESQVPAIGTTLDSLRLTTPVAVQWIADNINVNSIYDVAPPDSRRQITDIAHVTGNTIRLAVVGGIPSTWAVGLPIRVDGAANAVNNGDFAIASIISSSLITITNPGRVDDTADETPAACFGEAVLYLDLTTLSASDRLVDFGIFANSARTVPRSQIDTDWFSPTSDPADSILNIEFPGFAASVASAMAIQDGADEFGFVLGGARSIIEQVDNASGFQSEVVLGETANAYHIETPAGASFLFPTHPADLPPGERRIYRVASDSGNSGNDVSVYLGASEPANAVTSDEGFGFIDIPARSTVVIEAYNTGEVSGWRTLSGLDRVVESSLVTTVSSAAPGIIPIALANVPASQDGDSNRLLTNIAANSIELRANISYEISFLLDLRYEGPEQTGLTHVQGLITPRLTRGGSTTDIDRVTGQRTQPMTLSRNGDGSPANDATKPIWRYSVAVRHAAQVGDLVSLNLGYGTFPAGITASDFRIVGRKFEILAKIGY